MGQFRGGGYETKELFIKPIDIPLADQQLRLAQLLLFLFQLPEKAPIGEQAMAISKQLISYQPLFDKQLSGQSRSSFLQGTTLSISVSPNRHLFVRDNLLAFFAPVRLRFRS